MDLMLVAAASEDGGQILANLPHLQAAHKCKIKAHLTTHALAGLFATLTALPLKPRLLPHDVQRLIECSLLPHFTVIPLSAADYQATLATIRKPAPQQWSHQRCLAHYRSPQCSMQKAPHAQPEALKRPRSKRCHGRESVVEAQASHPLPLFLHRAIISSATPDNMLNYLEKWGKRNQSETRR